MIINPFYIKRAAILFEIDYFCVSITPHYTPIRLFLRFEPQSDAYIIVFIHWILDGKGSIFRFFA